MTGFQKATKKSAKLRMSIAGPSGSGKTYTALTFAKVFAPTGQIAVVDTEHGSASKYADQFDFDVMELSDFHPNHYVNAIKAAVNAGYEVIILDSITHAWNGKGGILSIVDKNFGKWKDVQPIEQAFVEAIVSSPIHIIATMRAKVQYEVEKDERGKPSPKKVGMGAIQRDGMEYEFDIAAMMDVQNNITIEKTRCSALQGVVTNRPDASFMAPVVRWLAAGPTPVTPAKIATANGNGPAPKPVNQQAVAESNAAIAALGVEDGGQLLPDAPPADEALRINALEIIEAANMKSPSHAQAWAVANGYRTDEHSARSKWMKMINDKFGGVSLTPPKIKEAITAYVELCLTDGKKQPETA